MPVVLPHDDDPGFVQKGGLAFILELYQLRFDQRLQSAGSDYMYVTTSTRSANCG